MTTPTTQEPQQPLSLVDHLSHLLADLKAQNTSALHQAEGWRKRIGRPDWNRLQQTEWDVKAEWTRQKSEALEQALAALTVLTHPDFYQLEDFGRPVDLCNGGRAYVSLQPLTSNDKLFYTGATVMDALLAAHAALKPQEGALPRKEHTDADT